MTSYESYFDHLTNGAYAPYVTDRRLVASSPTWMFDRRQPAGDFADPPVPEMTLIQDRRRARATCDFGAGRFRSVAGGLFLVPSMSATSVAVDNAHSIRTLAFNPKDLADWTEGDPWAGGLPHLGRLHASVFRNPLIELLLERIWEAGDAPSRTDSLFADAALLTLWAELLRQAQTPDPPASRGGLAAWQTRRCTDYLAEHAGDDIGLKELAALVGLSPFHFARAFKQSTGVPPHRYLLALRIDKAKALLRTSNRPVTEIALEVGYDSPQALARLFRRHVGISPGEYRRASDG